MTDVLWDARWIGVGGIGRVTAQAHVGLTNLSPAGDWTVWGAAATPAWCGASKILATGSPASWAGQRSMFDVPACDVALFPANLRPLRPVGRASSAMIYDTIPLRHESRRARRAAMHMMFRGAAYFSTSILTISEHSKRTIVADLGVAASSIRVIDLPYDRDLVAQIVRRRQPSENPLVAFVGRFAPHKNLDRLIEAFSTSEVGRRGGRLVLAGGSGPELERLRTVAASQNVDIEVRGRLSEDELIELYATASAMALPSLEEGFGLPVIEAAAAGIPIVAAAAGAVLDVVGDRMPLVDPLSVPSIAQGIDWAITQNGSTSVDLVRWAESFPTADDLGRAFAEEAERLAAPLGVGR